MSSSPDSSLLQRTIELKYYNKKQSSSLKWIVVNSILFLTFAYDLWGGCEGGLTLLQYVEAVALAVAAANLLQHAVRLLPPRRAPLPLTPAQRRLLGLQHTKLDSSFREVSPEAESKAEMSSDAEELELSPLARARSWASAHGGTGEGAGGSPPPSPQHSPYASPSRGDRDEFIADHAALADYLRRREVREGRSTTGGAWAAGGVGGAGGASPPAYQLAAIDAAEGGEEEGSAGGGGGSGAGAPPVWRRLQLDPRRLTEYNLNLRLWIQVTILERMVREMDALDAALAAHGLPPLGQVGVERLRAVAAGAVPALGALLPFLAPFPDQRYVVKRYRELASGGCLSAYRWAGGGEGWDEARPTDAELLLHIVATYMDAQLPTEGGAGAFSAAHTSRGGAPPRGPGVLSIHQVSSSPPHYVVARGEEALEVGAGRNNLLHCVLLLLAAAARRDPPALRRLHLGPAGLNVLWVIGQ